MGVELRSNKVQGQDEMLLCCLQTFPLKPGQMGVDIPLRGRFRQGLVEFGIEGPGARHGDDEWCCQFRYLGI